MGKIVVFGSYVTDLTGRCERFPTAGETVLGSSFKYGPGGKGSNQAVAAHRAGADITLVTKLGKDEFGRMAEEFYNAEGMNTGFLLKDEDLSTGVALILVNEKTAQNEIAVILGACNNITPEDIESRKTLIQNADYLLAQLEINIPALEKIIRIAYDSGTRVILNPAPAQPVSDQVLSMVDTVTPNETEAYTLTGIPIKTIENAASASEVFLQRGVKKVVITLGENGVFVTDGHKQEHIHGLKVDAIDTTGAGDAFSGTFAAALSFGYDLFDAARFGNCAAALSVTRRGTAPSMPSRAEIESLYVEKYIRTGIR